MSARVDATFAPTSPSRSASPKGTRRGSVPPTVWNALATSVSSSTGKFASVRKCVCVCVCVCSSRIRSLPPSLTHSLTHSLAHSLLHPLPPPHSPYGIDPIDIRPFWNVYETIMKSFRGRPHWAKAHSLNYFDLCILYPRFQDFCSLRQKMDPNGMFLNDYVRRHVLPNV